jgi:AraC-like DNA-binding protein
MLKYAEYSPSPTLARFVKCYWSLKGDAARGARRVERVLPDGCVELVLHLEEPMRRLDAPHRTGHRSAVVGQARRPVLIQLPDRFVTLGVRFRPAGARPFFGPPLCELSDRSWPLELFWGKRTGELETRLRDARETRQRIALLDAFLLRRLDPDVRATPAETAANHILAREGRVTVSEVAARAGTTCRTLERAFRAQVGIAPKLLARIARFQSVQRNLPRVARVGWPVLALACGYADQSHLVRDFRAFADAAPTAFVASEHALSDRLTRPRAET